MFKFEDDSSKLTFILIITIGIVILGCLIINSISEKRFIENGYSRQTLKGSACVHWVK